MKRFMTLLLAMLMVLSLAACGDKSSATVDAEGLGKALAERVQFDSTMSAIDAGDYLELPEGSSAAAYMSDGSTMEEIFVVSCKDKTDASAVKIAMQELLDRNSQIAQRPLDAVVRTRMMLDAYMRWGLEHPNAYELVFCNVARLAAVIGEEETTADLGFALLMAAARRVAEGEHYLRARKWDRWAYDMLIGQDVHGSTLGIIGMGRIGQAIARRGALGFGMKVIYHNRSRLPAADEAAVGARYVSKEELLRIADHVVLVVPYSAESHHTIGAAELALMKPTATLVNIARGGIVDDAALARALREGRIAAAGLDVFEGEPKVHPDLLTVPNVVLTPHIGSATVPTRKAMANLAADNLIGYLAQGRAVTPLNPEVIGA